MKLTFSFILILLLAASAMGATPTRYYASSGTGTGNVGVTGSDSANCTSTSTPCLSITGGLAKVYADHGTACADVKLILMGGAYNAGNGLKRGANNEFTALCSGTDDNHPFTIQAYKASDPTATGNCDSDPTHPIAGQSSCLPVTLIRDMPPGATVTLAQMQGIGGPGCGGLDCAGAPTLAECVFNPPGYSAGGYPGNCWSGAPNAPLYLFTNRGGGVTPEAVVELYGLQYDHPDNKPKYVVFDGVSCDARGVVSACYRNGQHNDHELMITHITWKNGEWINAVQSAMSQPGVSNGNDQVRPDYTQPCTPGVNCTGGIPETLGFKGLSYEFLIDCSHSAPPPAPSGNVCVQGPRTSNHMLMKNFKISKAGIPFDTLRMDQTHSVNGSSPLARDTEAAKFLHAFYLHTGGNTCDNCEITSIAGICFAPDGDDNHFINSYCHDANGGVQAFGVYQTVENSVFVNNGNVDIQSPAVGGGGTRDSTNRTSFINNTFIHGSRGLYGAAIQLGHGSHANMIQNNNFQGYTRGIEGSPGGCDFGSCSYADRVVVQNNVFDNVTNPVAMSGTDGVDIMFPSCTLGGGNNFSTLNTCNKFNPVGGLKFASTTGALYTLQSDSPAVDYGATNALTRDYIGNTRPFNALIDSGAFEYCTGGGCSAVPTTATISVFTSGTSANISWTGCTAGSLSSPHDSNFNLVCNLASTVTFTAPMTAGSPVLNFTAWSGCDSISSFDCTITSLSGGRTVNAGYGNTKTLTVNSTVALAVAMTVNPQDQAGRTNGTTNFSRSYLTNTNVTIAAPTTDTASGLFFAAWTGCDAVSGIINSVCSVTTGTADRTISAAYGGDGCGIEKVFNIKDNIEICPPLQTITIYDNFTFAGQPVGTHTTGDQGTVVGGPGDFEGTPYYQASFVTAPTLGWLTSVNIRSTTGPVIPPVIPSPSVQVGVGKYGAGVQIK